MTQASDFCFRCPCEPKSKQCLINNTLLDENGNYQCKLLRWQANQIKGE